MVIGCWLLILIVVEYLHPRPSLSHSPVTPHPLLDAQSPILDHVVVIEKDPLTHFYPPRGKIGSWGRSSRHFGFTIQNGELHLLRTITIQKRTKFAAKSFKFAAKFSPLIFNNLASKFS